MYKGADEVLPGVRDMWKFYEMSGKIDNENEIIKSPNNCSNRCKICSCVYSNCECTMSSYNKS